MGLMDFMESINIFQGVVEPIDFHFISFHQKFISLMISTVFLIFQAEAKHFGNHQLKIMTEPLIS